MIIKLKAFAIFGEVLGKERSVELGGKATVSDLLTELCTPPGDGAYDLIFNGSGMIKKHVHILINGRHILSLSGIKTELVDGDEVAIFPPVAGG